MNRAEAIVEVITAKDKRTYQTDDRQQRAQPQMQFLPEIAAMAVAYYLIPFR